MNVLSKLYTLLKKLQDGLVFVFGTSVLNIKTSANSELCSLLESLHKIICSVSNDFRTRSSIVAFLKNENMKNVYDLSLLILLFILSVCFISIGVNSPRPTLTYPIFTILMYLFLAPWKKDISLLTSYVSDFFFNTLNPDPSTKSFMKKIDLPTLVIAALLVFIIKSVYKIFRYVLMFVFVVSTWYILVPQNFAKSFTLYFFFIFAIIAIFTFIKITSIMEYLSLSIICCYTGSIMLVIYTSPFWNSAEISEFITDMSTFTYKSSNRITIFFFFILFCNFLCQLPYKIKKK